MNQNDEFEVVDQSDVSPIIDGETEEKTSTSRYNLEGLEEKTENPEKTKIPSAAWQKTKGFFTKRVAIEAILLVFCMIAVSAIISGFISGGYDFFWGAAAMVAAVVATRKWSQPGAYGPLLAAGIVMFISVVVNQPKAILEESAVEMAIENPNEFGYGWASIDPSWATAPGILYNTGISSKNPNHRVRAFSNGAIERAGNPIIDSVKGFGYSVFQLVGYLASPLGTS